jgi:CBS domain-containing protein
MLKILQSDHLGEDIRKYNLAHVDCEASVLETSRLMRDSGATEILVTDEIDGNLLGIGVVTANDIISRVVAAGLDPSVMTVGDIAWRGLAPAGRGGNDLSP